MDDLGRALRFLLSTFLCISKGGATRENGRIVDFDNRIVGGSDVPTNEYPWFVKFSGCGGSLISPQYVLTAAHCEQVLSGTVRVGALCNEPSSSLNCGQEQEYFQVVEYWIHPNFDDATLEYDFAIVKLSGESTIPPVSIDDGTFSRTYTSDTILWALGFGILYYGGQFAPSTLQHVDINYVEQSTCNEMYQSYGGVDETMMCAGGTGKDGCQGDSGGPLYDKINNVLVGVTSWGIGCGMDFPGVWARISEEFDWIAAKVCPNNRGPSPSYCNGVTAPPTTSHQPTQSPTFTRAPTTSPTAMSCDDDEMLVTLSLRTDQYGYETSWILTEYSTLTIVESDSSLEVQKEYVYKYCLPCSQYELNVTDTYGDGLISPGGYNVTVDNTLLDTYNYETDGGFKIRSTSILQSKHCPLSKPCKSDEITLDISHYGSHDGVNLRWTVEDTISGSLVLDRTDLEASQLNKVRVCLECGKYILRVWNEYNIAGTGGLSVAVDGNIIEQFNLLSDVGILNSTAFNGAECPIYYRMRSEYKYLGIEFCIEPKNVAKHAVLMVKPCKDSTKQLWRSDELGQFHSYENDSLCITKAQHKLRLRPCMTTYNSDRSKSIAYSFFTKQLIWMNNAKMSLSIDLNPRKVKEVIFQIYNGNNSPERQWIIEEG